MNVLHISTNDILGGAALGTYRIHLAHQDIGLKSRLLVARKLSMDPSILMQTERMSYTNKLKRRIRWHLGQFPLYFYRKKSAGIFSLGYLPSQISRTIKKIDPDIIVLHWICEEYLQIEEIAKFHKPIVWVMPDMWPFTGGCHYSFECSNYKSNCGQCPILGSSSGKDISRWVWNRKMKSWKNKDIILVGTSSWIANRAQQSSLFRRNRITIIPYPLDLECFQPRDKNKSRKELNLPLDKQLILFGAYNALKNPHKGHDIFLEALSLLAKSKKFKDRFEVVIFGANKPDDPVDYGFPVHFLGYVQIQEKLAKIYDAVDVMVVPSPYEAFGQTASEALSCATPVVAFENTGVADIVDHLKTGYLAKRADSNDLASGIKWILGNDHDYQQLSKNARKKALATYHPNVVAQKYKELYHEMLQ